MTDKPPLGLRRIRGAGWRRGAPTPKQKDYLVLERLTKDYGDDENWPITAGEANDIIHKHWLARQAESSKDHSNDFEVEPVRFREVDLDFDNPEES